MKLLSCFGTRGPSPYCQFKTFVFLEYLTEVGSCLHSNHGNSESSENLLRRVPLFCSRHLCIAHLFARFLCPPTGSFLHISCNSSPCSHMILVSPGLKGMQSSLLPRWAVQT
ncbi:hypothetical protein DENSPDRAFT_300215 [Dentipellis sp. KUC8613]|nr:hypothetical protein DENSPDRAFT_300215 [Dentipellis sp. KUC8613]